MASRGETVQYLVDQLAGAHGISTRKMFGEYAIYLQDKLIGFICDDQFYLKPSDALARLLESPKMASPRVGARPHFLITDELEQRELLRNLVQATANALPIPKSKPKPESKTLPEKLPESGTKPAKTAHKVVKKTATAAIKKTVTKATAKTAKR